MQADKMLTDSSQEMNSLLFFSKSLTPTAMSASISVQEEAYTAIGAPSDLRTTDVVFVTQPPVAISANVAVIGGRVTGAQEISLQFANLTAAANTPKAGRYGFLIVRP